jgi:hypothetical protein
MPGRQRMEGRLGSAPHQPAHLSSENRGRGRQNENLKPHRQSPKVPEPAPKGRCGRQLADCQKTWWCVFIKFLPTLGFEKPGQDALADAGRCPNAGPTAPASPMPFQARGLPSPAWPRAHQRGCQRVGAINQSISSCTPS